MTSIFKISAAALLCVILYLAFWPVSVRPVAWQAPEDAGYQGGFAANDHLAALRMIDLEGRIGPEDADIGPDGMIYTATHGGEILRLGPEDKIEGFAQTQGR
ncbi:MAG: SMP-30/gluconolactonase/LRE family protein, partial [Mangrovicoccus sp.]|nr:SMP-30/gluconolactonase/LRE family protein [Mangrovicoccus sp.]